MDVSKKIFFLGKDTLIKNLVLYRAIDAKSAVTSIAKAFLNVEKNASLEVCKRVSALRYSFLLAIPAVLASGLNELGEAISGAPSAFSLSETFVATIVAFLVGYTVIAWLMKLISTRSFAPFVLYRVLLGLAVIGALSTGLIG